MVCKPSIGFLFVYEGGKKCCFKCDMFGAVNGLEGIVREEVADVRWDPVTLAGWGVLGVIVPTYALFVVG